MKKFKHTNADLEMARIQTEKESSRANSDAGHGGGDTGTDNNTNRKGDEGTSYAKRGVIEY